MARSRLRLSGVPDRPPACFPAVRSIFRITSFNCVLTETGLPLVCLRFPRRLPASSFAGASCSVLSFH